MRSTDRSLQLGLLAALLSAAAAPLAAQGPITVLGGFVSAKAEVSGDGLSISLSSRSGLAAGIGTDWAIGSTLRFAPEFLFVQKGFELSAEGVDFGIKIGYIEVPLLLRADLGSPGSSVRPFVLAGPSIGIKLSCKVTGTADDIGTVSTDCESPEDDVDLPITSTDIGAMFGGGLQFGRYAVSVRYDLGLADVLDDADGENVSYKNRALMILGSIAF